MKVISYLLLVLLAATGRTATVDVPECPEKYGVQVYSHPENCDQFFLCTNGTLTLETCENGLLFDGKAAVHNHCNYFWAVECGTRIYDVIPEQSPGCGHKFGIYPLTSDCSTSYVKCEHGEARQLDCEPGLAYDERIHGCNWPDQLLHICNPEAVVGFRCPTKVPPNSASAKFWPFPRFAIPGDCRRLISCVEGHPRLITCENDKVFNENALICDDPENVPNCKIVK